MPRPASSSPGSSRVEDPPRFLDGPFEPAAPLVPCPRDVVGYAPAAGAITIEAELGERIQPGREVERVTEGRAGLDLALADEWLRVDHEPRLALGAEDVGAMEILVDETACRAIDGSVDVHRCFEQGPLERNAGLGVPAWHGVCPAVSCVGEGWNSRGVVALDLQSWD